MAYNNNYNSYNNQRQPSRGGFTPAPAAPVEPKAIPANYVDLAETLMSANSKSITTSKLRNWFSIANDIYNVESRSSEIGLKPESCTKLLNLRVRIVYDAGKDSKIKDFCHQREFAFVYQRHRQQPRADDSFCAVHGSLGCLS